jgi:hypothetical protein
VSTKPKKSPSKLQVINALMGIQEQVEDLLATLCPPCPKCCPPRFPLSPGETANHGTGDISTCKRCCGRGYMLPEDDDE